MPERSSLWYLKQINLLKELPEERLKQMESMFRPSEVPKRKVIFFPEEASQTIYFLKRGRVKISRLAEDGREVILDIIEPGEIFGEMVLASGGKREHIAEAMDDAIVCAIRKQDFEEMLRKNPEINLQFSKKLSDRLRDFQSKVEDLAFKDVTKRVISFVLRYAERFGKHLPDGIYVKRFLSHEEIGQVTATSRQTVTTVLNDLKRQGLIDFKRNFLKVKNAGALRKLSS